jgi:hypothetical protein
MADHGIHLGVSNNDLARAARTDLSRLVNE